MKASARRASAGRFPMSCLRPGEIPPAGLVLLLTLIFSGGFYGYSAMLAGLGISALILVLLFADRPVKYCFGRMLPPVLYYLYLLLMALWAVDGPLHLAGCVKLLPCLFWFYVCMQMTTEDKEALLGLLPAFGVFTTAAGLAVLPFPALSERLWQAGRLGGFFQYSNTCALFLLLGLAVLVNRGEQGGWSRAGGDPPGPASSGRRGACFGELVLYAEAAFLLLGILLTGSRGVLLITGIWGLITALRRRRLPVFALAAVTVLILSLLWMLGTGSAQGIGRILTLRADSSTVLGRLLYWKDGLKILLRFPMGLGFEGYAYVQPVYQNGVYTTRYVHNELLQSALDMGVLPSLFPVAWLLHNLLKGRQSSLRKELLILMLISSMADFHLQYLMILFLVILCPESGGERGPGGNSPLTHGISARMEHLISGGGGERNLTRPERIEMRLFMAAALIAFSYFMIPFGALRLHSYSLCLDFFPHETEAELALLRTAETAEEAEHYARELLSHNRYAAEAYKSLGYAAYLRSDAEGAMDAMDRMIGIRRYAVREYAAYDEMLDHMEDELAGAGETALRETVSHRRKALREELQRLAETTDPLAYRLRDVPVFTWDADHREL